jgi:inorganic pyrophosphatase
VIHPWLDVTPAIDTFPLPVEFKAVIESPKGPRNKYELDKTSGLLKLDRVLQSAVLDMRRR